MNFGPPCWNLVPHLCHPNKKISRSINVCNRSKCQKCNNFNKSKKRIGLGFALRQVNMSPREIMYVTFPGELLMRILKMMVLPLVISSLITGGFFSLAKTYGRIGLRAFSYYMVTTVIATFTGIALAVSIKPGKSSRQTSEPSGGKSQTVQSVDSFLDLIRNMLPSNLVEACFKKVRSMMFLLQFLHLYHHNYLTFVCTFSLLQYKTVYKSSGNHLDVMNTPSNSEVSVVVYIYYYQYFTSSLTLFYL
uniref:Amino acid transporter n=1 Tax=Kryptolebias marmoratus TaxID=37003 RepID=A0A3Q3H1E7_KRYMA